VSDDRNLRRRFAVVILAVGWLVYVAVAWRSMGALRRQFEPMAFRDCFTPGMVDTVEVIRERGVSRVFGPHHDVYPFAFHRLNEMLYPIMYYTPTVPEQLQAGDLFVLLPEQEPPVPSKLVSKVRYFRLMEVSP